MNKEKKSDVLFFYWIVAPFVYFVSFILTFWWLIVPVLLVVSILYWILI